MSEMSETRDIQELVNTLKQIDKNRCRDIDCKNCPYRFALHEDDVTYMCRLHLYANELYNRGYRNSPPYPMMAKYEVKAIMKEQLQPIVKELTIQEVDKAVIKAVKAFAISLMNTVLEDNSMSDIVEAKIVNMINDKLNDYFNCIKKEEYKR